MEVKKIILETLPGISWTAIFSGVFISFGINFLLNLGALALGISVFSLSDEGKMVFSLYGFAAFSVIAFLTMYITGWIAGRLSPRVFAKRIWGSVIGLIAWALLLIITIIIITNMIQFVAFHSNFTSHPNLAAIKITNDAPMMTETKESSALRSPLDINIEKMTKIISLNAYATFVLFMFAALSICLGGYIGYGSYRYISSDKIKRLPLK